MSESSHKYSRVAAVILLIYDYCLTFDDQILFLSKRPIRLIHGLFLLARYLPFAAAPIILYESLDTNLNFDNRTCWTFYDVTGTAIWYTILAAESLIVIRTIALCHDYRITKRILIGGFLSIFLYSFAMSIYMSVKKTNNDSWLSTMPDYNCLPTLIEPMAVACSAADALFELYISQLTIRHGVFKYIYRDIPHMRFAGRLQTTLSVGSLLFSIPLAAISLINVSVITFLPQDSGWAQTCLIYQGIMHSTLGTRILFDLRHAGRVGAGGRVGGGGGTSVGVGVGVGSGSGSGGTGQEDEEEEDDENEFRGMRLRTMYLNRGEVIDIGLKTKSSEL